MKKETLIYWISTGLISATMIYSGLSYLISEEMKQTFIQMGFPDYFRIQLGVAKVAGAVVLLLPFVSRLLKVFTYSGFAIAYISALIAHVSIGDPPFLAFKALLLLGILVVSFIYLQKTRLTQVK